MKEYKGLKVPEINYYIATPRERQKNLCFDKLVNEKCDKDCDNCILDSHHLKTFEQYEKENNNGHN
jgi:hypothetical protein